MYFESNVIHFDLYVIKIFDAKLLKMNKDEAVVPSSENWKVSMCVTLDTMMTEHQDCLTFLCMAEKLAD